MKNPIRLSRILRIDRLSLRIAPWVMHSRAPNGIEREHAHLETLARARLQDSAVVALHGIFVGETGEEAKHVGDPGGRRAGIQ